NAMLGLVCAAATLVGAGAASLAACVLAQALVAMGGAAIVFGALRGAPRWKALAGRIGALAGSVGSEIAARPPVPAYPLMLAFAARSLQVVELGLLVQAMGVPLHWWSGPVAEGAVAIGGTLGDIVPGQLGALDGALVIVASTLETTATPLTGAALLFHATQL